MSAATSTTWSLCTCDDSQHAYPDCDAPDDWSTDRGVAELVGAYIPASTPRHLLRRTAVVTVEVVHAHDADPDAPVGEIPPTLRSDLQHLMGATVTARIPSGGVR